MSSAGWDYTTSTGAAKAWKDAGITGKGVTVAVLDSGYSDGNIHAPRHVMPGRYYYWKETEDGSHRLWLGRKMRLCRFFSSNDIRDNDGHGTIIAGIIAAMAPEVIILTVKVFGNDPARGLFGGCASSVVAGINYAVEQKADVICMAFGFQEELRSIDDALVRADAAGCLLIAAAGNNGKLTSEWPAAHPSVISVGALGRDGRIAKYSNYGEVYAPGDSIYSASHRYATGTAFCSGTSPAAAIVSGAAALAKEVRPELTTAELREALLVSGGPAKDSGIVALRADRLVKAVAVL